MRKQGHQFFVAPIEFNEFRPRFGSAIGAGCLCRKIKRDSFEVVMKPTERCGPRLGSLQIIGSKAPLEIFFWP